MEEAEKPVAERKFITFAEAAAYLGKGRSAFYELCREQGIPYYQVGATRMFTVADLDAWIASQRRDLQRGKRRRRVKSW